MTSEYAVSSGNLSHYMRLLNIKNGPQDGITDGNIDVDKPWNPRSLTPISEWLQSTQEPEELERLKCMGNIVVPLQAVKAASVLSQMRSLLESRYRL